MKGYNIEKADDSITITLNNGKQYSKSAEIADIKTVISEFLKN